MKIIEVLVPTCVVICTVYTIFKSILTRLNLLFNRIVELPIILLLIDVRVLILAT